MRKLWKAPTSLISDATALTTSDLRSELRAILDHARRDAAIFAITTVILTPFFVTIAVIMLFFALAFVDLPGIDHLGYALSFVTGVNLTLAFMVVSYFLRPKAPYQKRESDVLWVVVAIGFFCTLLVFSYGTSLVKTHPSYFWPIYCLLSLAMLGCVGHAYEARQSYYLGWMAGPYLFDNPFTVEDDIDRAHLSLGLTMAMSYLVMESYSAIFGSTWLWRRLEESELSAAVELLQALASNDVVRARECIQSLSATSAFSVMRALTKLDMITIENGYPRLSLKGRELLHLEDW